MFTYAWAVAAGNDNGIADFDFPVDGGGIGEGPLHLVLNVTNTGGRVGDCVVLAFTTPPPGGVALLRGTAGETDALPLQV